MRLRQLGTTQSVVFFAPPEVDQSIRDTCGLETSDKTDKKVFVNSSHVVAWLLEQTCKANDQLRPLYASHGLDFCRRMEALTMHKKTLRSASSRDSLLGVLEQPERQTLETMYGNDTVDTGSVLKTDGFSYPRLQRFAEQLRTYRSTTGHGTAALQGAFEEVEQEREVEVQVEQQRRAQHNIDFKALRFNGTVAKSIRQFVETGELTGNNGYEGMFSFLASTSIGKRYGIVHGTPSRLFVTTEFRKTIDASRAGQQFHDDFLRPVDWLLWCPASQTGVVIIPEELELLIPSIRASKYTQLVAYAAPVTRSMLDFSSLRFYAFPEFPKKRHTVPEWLPIELGILAGRLYMTYDEATAMAKYLGLSPNANEDCVRNTMSFCTNPTSFLLEWLALRRATQDVLHTPAAYVCQGRQLQPDHSFFLKFNKRLIHGEDEQGMNDDILEQQEQIMEDDEKEDMEEEDEHDEEGDGLLKIRLENLALLDGNMKVQAQDEQKRDGEKVPL
ncbi:uncharacterized protein SPSK_01675 [Sporothrix schenckii 1099-18]|uniref:ubiquitinyl hydrolase 1 n=1 Tax=Sporothrix schenckii 1099-18 TaxID=1397361 RepID=A0A0F2MCX4_SPOSC|nr:uncharacterized protein SPSK_01675 [Sporothrix schenckii 1099-18]KJR87487.1 hypothetical protein SPSK_01675 [Sporothrix schenckii 1099-18]